MARSAVANKESAEAAYRAFSAGDAAAAMEDMDPEAVWTVGGDSSLTGTYKGKQEIGGLWARFGEKGLKTEPHDFVADGDKVVVLTTVTLDGESAEVADVLTYGEEGHLIAFEQVGSTAIADRVFPK
jgi:ketosteroid isomerase-like protein